MRKHKRICFLCLLPVFLLIFGGCSSEKEKPKEDKAGYRIYYINKDETAVVTEPYAPKGDTTGALLEEFLVCLRESSGEREEKPAIPEDVVLLDYTLDKGQLSLQFNLAYLDMNPLYEILCRSAIVRTLCQIPEVETVSFMVGDSPLMDSNEIPIGALNEESFVENAGDEINTYTKTTLTLYFANEKGDRLTSERVEIRYSSNMSVEKLVVERLIKGPITKNAYPAIPSNTKIVSIATKDGICYVNLDDGFLGQGYDVLEQIPVYSIVNSLTEIPGISKVQILINGETNITYQESIRFETLFERNLDLIEEP
ncbi:MAG: GerMN domain-containing protein [Lachnospiraceae bacterium]|jgi:germination protein M|nr:GerMN domain-containing protein [Lachnospiraceae bacterium]MCI9018013.1 GerMN domain-containing protein [Lachnospiraceae bacterium]MCI9305099.1 GerMN domain-containing protein [Lachnospiraceae bacterium]